MLEKTGDRDCCTSHMLKQVTKDTTAIANNNQNSMATTGSHPIAISLEIRKGPSAEATLHVAPIQQMRDKTSEFRVILQKAHAAPALLVAPHR